MDFLNHTPPESRLKRFHVNHLDVYDDFPILWSWFEEDAILQSMGKPRLHTNSDNFFTGNHLWNVLIKRLCQEYSKSVRDNSDYTSTHTALIEFSRGTEHGGYTTAYQHISQQILDLSAVLYIDVPWEESLRKNRARFNPKRPDSILEHGLDDNKMLKLYRHDDWYSFSQSDPNYLTIKGVKVPYAVFANKDDVTSQRGEKLGRRLEDTLQKLWTSYRALHNYSTDIKNGATR